MNPEISTSFNTPDPNANPLNLTQLVQLLDRLVSTQMIGSYIPYVLQSTQPGVDDQDKAWIELDTAGRPKSIKVFYNGHWRRIYNGMLGEVRGFSGNPGYNTTGPFDVTGLGVIGGDYDGWHICNGQGGTPDLSNKFVCGANLNNPPGHSGGYDSTNGWETFIDTTTGSIAGGGAWKPVIKPENVSLPVLSQTFMSRYRIGGGGETEDTAGLLWGVDAGAPLGHWPIPGGTPPSTSYTYPPSTWPANGGAGNPAAIGFMAAPPFYSLAWMIFVGYA